ncbi:MAG: tail fiber protein, partial [Burkholderiaceae bacterium]
MKRNRSTRRMLLCGAAASGLTALSGGSAWACSGGGDEIMGSVCLMALNRGGGAYQVRGYQIADGTLLPISQYTALFALLGTVYGGDGRATFGVPDLRGRTVIGAGQLTGASTNPNYTIGQKGGSEQVVLNPGQLPMHAHTLAGTGTVSLANVTGSVDLSQATGGATLDNIPFSAASTNLALKASSGGGNATSPAGSALAEVAAPPAHIYNASTPNVAMIAGSISGTADGRLAGTAPVKMTGVAPVSLTGGTAQLGGGTGVTGGNAPVQVMPPYLA